MDSPFIYDKYVSGKNFIGRKNECAILQNLLTQHENVVISSPPKTGKMSLIQQTLFNMRVSGKGFRVGQFSVLNVRSFGAFITRFGSTVIRMNASTPSEYSAYAGKYLANTHLVFDQDRFSDSDEVLSLNWDPDENDLLDVLRMPYRIASEKNEPMILIIDECQNIMMIDEGDEILNCMEEVIKEMRTSLKAPFSYIMCGSMINAMKEIFYGGRHLYRCVEHFSLQDVDEKDIVEHLVKGFLASGKVIDRDLLLGACRLFRNNLWYMNHFVSICDSKSKGYIMEPILMEALDCILAIHEPRFRSIMNSLTTHQVNLLAAIIDGCPRLSSSEVVRKYSLNSSANVKRVKDALMKKEIVTFDRNDVPTIIDPLFEYWVKKYFYEKKD